MQGGDAIYMSMYLQDRAHCFLLLILHYIENINIWESLIFLQMQLIFTFELGQTRIQAFTQLEDREPKILTFSIYFKALF